MTDDPTRTRAPRAAKAPARKAAPRRPAAIEGTIVGKAQTETLTAAAPAPAPAVAVPTIEFRGRTLPVRRPGDEQLMVFISLGKRMEEPQYAARLRPDPLPGESREQAEERARNESQRLFERLMKIIGSVLVDPDDKEWLIDQYIDGLRINAEDGEESAVQIVHLALAATSKATASAPRTGPQSKARRRT